MRKETVMPTSKQVSWAPQSPCSYQKEHWFLVPGSISFSTRRTDHDIGLCISTSTRTDSYAKPLMAATHSLQIFLGVPFMWMCRMFSSSDSQPQTTHCTILIILRWVTFPLGNHHTVRRPPSVENAQHDLVEGRYQPRSFSLASRNRSVSPSLF
jgi:hypothetical protein